MPQNTAHGNKGFFGFWKHIPLTQKATLLFAAAFVFLLPFALLASQSQTRTTPKASTGLSPTSPFLQETLPTTVFHRSLPLPNKVPKNPDNISAKCALDNLPIDNNSLTNCTDLEFTWGGNAKGFFVYFGPKEVKQLNMLTEGQFQTGKTFSPDNLQTGTKYYLFIQEMSADGNLLWKSGGNADPSKAKDSTFTLTVE